MCGKSREHDEHSGARCHQGIGAKPRHALPPLALRADESPEDKRESQANCKLVPKHVSSFRTGETRRARFIVGSVFFLSTPNR
jgi:hypothetical protein